MDGEGAQELNDVLADCDEQIADSRDSGDPVTRRRVRRAFARKAVALRKLGRVREAIAVWDEAVAWVDADPDGSDAAFAAAALVEKAADLRRTGEDEAAVRTTRLAAARCRRLDDDAVAARLEARALVTESTALTKLGRVDQAIVIDDEIIARFDGADEPRMRLRVAGTLVRRSAAHFKLGNVDAGLSDSEMLVQRFLDETDADARATMTWLLTVHSRALLRIGGPSPREFITHAGLVLTNVVTEGTAAIVRRAGIDLDSRLAASGLVPARVREVRLRAQHVLSTSDVIVRADADTEDEDLQRAVATARLHRAVAHIQLGHLRRGGREFDRLVKVGSEAVAAVFNQQAQALSTDDAILSELGSVANLAHRAWTLGGSDKRIARIAFEESTRPGVPGAPRSRRARLLARLLSPR